MLANSSLRCLLIEAIGAHLSTTIRIADGYTHDIPADQVKLGTSFLPSNDRPPLIVVFEHMAGAGEDAFRAQKAGGNDDPALAYWVPFDISGWGEVGKNNFPAKMTYELMADVKKALGALDGLVQEGRPFYGLNILDVVNDPGVVLPQSLGDKGNLPPQFVVQVRIQISESGADPYRLDD